MQFWRLRAEIHTFPYISDHFHYSYMVIIYPFLYLIFICKLPSLKCIMCLFVRHVWKMKVNGIVWKWMFRVWSPWLYCLKFCTLRPVWFLKLFEKSKNWRIEEKGRKKKGKKVKDNWKYSNDFLLPGSGRPKWNGLKRIWFHNTNGFWKSTASYRFIYNNEILILEIFSVLLRWQQWLCSGDYQSAQDPSLGSLTNLQNTILRRTGKTAKVVF